MVARPSQDVQAAAWIFERLVDRSCRVDSLLPPGFAAYVRLLHPLESYEAGQRRLVRWRELADTAGAVRLDRQVQFDSLRLLLPDLGDNRPGQLPDDDLLGLIRVLRSHTQTPDRCWFCLWEGYGDPQHRPGDAEASAALFAQSSAHTIERRPSALAKRWLGSMLRQPNPTAPPFATDHRNSAVIVYGPLERRYTLYIGPIEASLEFSAPVDRWWPDDHMWCIATDTDLDSTYVGGSLKLADELLHHSQLEAVPAQLDDMITTNLDQSAGR